ncbi:hypothetical protein PGT21_012026 [Puccinia graminis f. sp. tritici]|uniref:Secreted protein n=1 Tax=Puccinia graminis f. sp. tritici TaxID=56615 RepID=A0A5B0R097_PUCGR|nr:hypothetical protein PGT21_012026 [Puccinia graminis f. sp. tritici]
MFFQTRSIVILAIVSVTLSHLSSGGMAESVCANWWNSLPAGQKPVFSVKVHKQPDENCGRIDGRNAAFNTTTLTPGTGACGITYTDDTKGACLWGGLNSVEPVPQDQQPGWLTGANTKNCGKKFFINRGDHHATGTFVDSCSFAGAKKLTIEEGCSTIYVTLATYKDLGGDPSGTMRIQVDNWDFDASTPPQ